MCLGQSFAEINEPNPKEGEKMFRLNSVQAKVGGFLVLILFAAFAVSTLVNTYQASARLSECGFRAKPATDSAAKWATCSGANWARHSAVKWATDCAANWATFIT